MTQTQQPEALRLADKYEIEGFLQDHRFAKDHWCRQAAAELRHQHARIAELEDVADMAIKRIAELESQLSAIGAGGVEPLRKQAAETSNDILTMADALIIQCTADARDAARYRWLRDNDWRNDEKMEPVIRLHLNAIWDEKIDAAMAAQARNKKGIEK